VDEPRLCSRRPPVRLLAVAVVAILVGSVTAWVGSAGGGDGTDQGPLVDPNHFAAGAAVCSLLTPNDLAQALGYAYEDGVEPELSNAFVGLPGITKCAYEAIGNYTETGAGLVQTGVVYAYAEQILEEAVRRGAKANRFRKINESSLPTYWDSQAKELVVLSDGKLVAVLVPSSGIEPEMNVIELARRLAIKAIERMP